MDPRVGRKNQRQDFADLVAEHPSAFEVQQFRPHYRTLATLFHT